MHDMADGVAEKPKKHLPGDAGLRIFVTVLGLAALMQVWVGPKKWNTHSWPLTIVIIAVAGPLLVRPELIRRLKPTGVKLPFLEVTFAESYQPSEETEQPEAGETPGRPGRDEEVRWVAAQMKIQRKLAYLIKHTIPAYEDAREPAKAPHVAFATIGSLLHDEYIDAAEAERLQLILTSPWALIAAQPVARRAELLAVAENLAQTMRAKVLKRMVVKDLKAASGHLSIEDEDAKGRLFVRFPSGKLTEVWPTWGRPDLSLVKARLSKLSSGGGIVVTPFAAPSAALADTQPDGVLLVSLADLPRVLSSGDGPKHGHPG
jgi:hypothetical protein